MLLTEERKVNSKRCLAINMPNMKFSISERFPIICQKWSAMQSVNRTRYFEGMVLQNLKK